MFFYNETRALTPMIKNTDVIEVEKYNIIINKLLYYKRKCIIMTNILKEKK